MSQSSVVITSPPPSLPSSESASASQLYAVPVYSGDRSTFSNFLKLFQTWTMAYYARNALLVPSEPIFVVGKERAELDTVHGREGKSVYCCMARSGEGD